MSINRLRIQYYNIRSSLLELYPHEVFISRSRLFIIIIGEVKDPGHERLYTCVKSAVVIEIG